MKTSTLITGLALAAVAVACQNPGHEEDDEHEIAVSAVPASVRAAAEREVRGFVIEEACLESEGGVTIYCLEGRANGKEYEIDVAADGKVLEVEAAGDEDHHEGDDDEDEDEDEDDD